MQGSEPYARFREREGGGGGETTALEHEDDDETTDGRGVAVRWVSFLNRGGKYAVLLLWLGVLAAAPVFASKGMANLRLSVQSPDGSPSAVAQKSFQNAFPDTVRTNTPPSPHIPP